jgi:hypothetical protein
MEELKVFPVEGKGAGSASTADAVLDQASQQFVGRWNRLVSTTNWEKGRIINEWRQALIEAGAPAREYSDEAWARRVGAVTGQHVGRLRRVHERFGATAGEYKGLYWSHFHAALDWDDAEMWLEGAVQSGWSVSQMRRQRWQATGAVEADRPRDADIVVAGVDEDIRPETADPTAQRRSDAALQEQGPPVPEGPDFGDEAEPPKSGGGDDSASIYTDEHPAETVEFVRPFENLAELPDDLSEAFEAFKLAILRHKADDWQQISREDVLAALDSLKELALAPTVD